MGRFYPGITDRMWPHDLWPQDLVLLKKAARLRDRLIKKYDPGEWSARYGYLGEHGVSHHHTFQWLMGDDMELSWAPTRPFYVDSCWLRWSK